jgi:hypothetical protein
MAHWYLKAMHVPPTLRNDFQQAKTLPAVEATLNEIAARGPTVGSRYEQLPELHIPVPSGPVEHW